MKRRIFKYSNKLITILFTIAILLSFYFTLVSPNFTLGDTTTPHVIGERTTIYLTIFLLLLGLFILSLFLYQKWRDTLYKIFVTYGKITASLLFIAVIFWQLLFVFVLHPVIGFDPHAIISALSNQKDPELIGYFSLNTNNLFLLLVLHQLVLLFHTKTWLFFGLVSLFFTDLSALLNFITIKILAPKKVVTGIYLHALFLASFPMILVPYSDTFVLPFVSLMLLCYAIAFRSGLNVYLKLVFAFLGGISLSVTYFIKPSAIIPAIAMLIVEVIFLFKPQTTKRIVKTVLVCLVFFGAGSYLSYQTLNNYVSNQNFIPIQKGRTIPPLHFISMGMTGDGGYDPKQALAMSRLDHDQKIAYSKANIKKQLKQKGFFGYLKFLFFKHQANVSDGTFAWLREGNFFKSKAPDKTWLERFLASFIYPGGKHLADFRYLSQLVWLLILSLICFGKYFEPPVAWIQVLKLGLLGGFLYLLIFEGGRSRYLIQFLPLFLLLATFCFTNAKLWFKRHFSWLMTDINNSK